MVAGSCCCTRSSQTSSIADYSIFPIIYLPQPSSHKHRRRRWKRISLTNRSSSSLHITGLDRSTSNHHVRAPAWHVAGARVQDVPLARRHLQRLGPDSGSALSSTTYWHSHRRLERLECAESHVRRRRREQQGESEQAFCQVGEPGRAECCE